MDSLNEAFEPKMTSGVVETVSDVYLKKQYQLFLESSVTEGMKQEYQKFFKEMLKAYNCKTIGEMDKVTKGKFFKEVSEKWKKKKKDKKGTNETVNMDDIKHVEKVANMRTWESLSDFVSGLVHNGVASNDNFKVIEGNSNIPSHILMYKGGNKAIIISAADVLEGATWATNGLSAGFLEAEQYESAIAKPLGILNEEKVSNDKEFEEYAMKLLKKAHGDDFDETKAKDTIDGLKSKYDGDYDKMVGALQSGLAD